MPGASASNVAADPESAVSTFVTVPGCFDASIALTSVTVVASVPGTASLKA